MRRCGLLMLAAAALGLAAEPAISSRVAEAMTQLRAEAGKIHDPKLRQATLDGLQPNTCIAHRAGLTDSRKAQIVEWLVAEGLADTADGSQFPGGLVAGIFPAVKDDGSACPQLPQRFESAPGSSFGGHHSYPGGLAMHESFNLASSLNFAELYRSKYGPGVAIDPDLTIAAPIWHDWAKTIVFQWKPDGTELEELNFGGNAKIASKTGAHHILGLAETMKRGLRADLIVAQASAHQAPVLGNEYKVVNWIRAAAIIAGVDPVQRGFLLRNGAGELRLPAFRIEDSIDNLSDADFVVSIPAAVTADAVLRQVAPEFGFDPKDTARYNLHFRNPVLSWLSAERVLMIYTDRGLDGVRAEIRRVPAIAP